MQTVFLSVCVGGEEWICQCAYIVHRCVFSFPLRLFVSQHTCMFARVFVIAYSGNAHMHELHSSRCDVTHAHLVCTRRLFCGVVPLMWLCTLICINTCARGLIFLGVWFTNVTMLSVVTTVH
eukprot:GDKI01017257.1.p1 GENE.GDKI01017257.1~~GDKI01017257.1.p1  ORF type:complete len:122 (-),score=11.67 GDKI01017257.1:19-384(-)